MDQLTISEIMLTVSAKMRAYKMTLEDAFREATCKFNLSDQQRTSLLALIGKHISDYKPSPLF